MDGAGSSPEGGERALPRGGTLDPTRAPSPALGLRGQVAVLALSATLVALAFALDRGPSVPPPQVGPLELETPYLGLAVKQLEARLSITSVEADSPAARAGLRVGDVVVSLDGLEVDDWERALRRRQAGERIALVIERGPERLTVEVELAPSRT